MTGGGWIESPDDEDAPPPTPLQRQLAARLARYLKKNPDDYWWADEEGDRNARLLLSMAAAHVLKQGLSLLGIEVPERM